ncbi:ParB/RepB/Spo0J family partition protein [Sinomicrobium kalidii]|uniref:ParB/RepB/Spo0J family partition protein n=1 Tax=Sinomicrobium kalidii TaxID=2900738 RepID=UPI001E2B2454|nr:ParB/RepB/Spo0J family partition protein [Sinomicrobium kalidii]UGU15439.1 ParB/RepB/Spo0J family partition protein [Sinomicrobium kalidii]
METQTKQTRKTTGQKKTSSKSIKTAAATLKVQYLDMDAVVPDPQQPRKTFDESSLNLLSQSIAEHGVLQPITVRKSEKDFIIVMGERRYRAGKLAGLKTIPAIVRDYENNDVLEVQIIENLQRKDVEPTEEAEAIAFLTDRYDPTDIAKRLGRSENFVRQRLKLAGLIEGFKAFIRSGEMSLSLGVAVALFEPEEQQMMLESLGGEFHANRLKRMVNNQTFDLANAPFDLSDKKLLPKAGACTLCPFNAANQGNLFGNGKMVCTRTACFENKKAKTLLNLIERAKKEKLLLVPDINPYWVNEEHNQLVMTQMEKQGLTIHLPDELEIIEEPIEPTSEIIKEKKRFYNYTDEELQEDLDEAMTAYKEAKEQYDTALDHGFEKGILLHTDSYKTGKIFVKIRETSGEEETTRVLPLEQRKMSECTPAEQIIKIKAREERKKEIENNKLFEEVVEMIRETNYIDTDKPLSADEMAAFAIALYENNIGYYDQSQYFKGFYGDTVKMSREEIVANFRKNFKEATLNRLIRFLLTRQVHFGEYNHTNDRTNIAFYTAVQKYHKADIDTIEARYAEARDKREKRLKERVTALQKQVRAMES